MSYVDFNTYEVYDPYNNTTVSEDGKKITGFADRSNPTGRRWRDYGIDFFPGNLTQRMEVRGNTPLEQAHAIVIWMLGNEPNAYFYSGQYNNDFFAIRLFFFSSQYVIQLFELDGTTAYSQHLGGYTNGVSTWLEVSRDMSLGDYGTLILKTFSDNKFSVLVNVKSIALHSSIKKMRYHHAVSEYNNGYYVYYDWYVANLDLGLDATEITVLAPRRIGTMDTEPRISLHDTIPRVAVMDTKRRIPRHDTCRRVGIIDNERRVAKP